MENFQDVSMLKDVLGHTREMLAIEHVTVVGNLHWDKMQALFQALCKQMQSQAEELKNQGMRLSKVEENDQRLAALEAELGTYKEYVKQLEESQLQKDSLTALEDQKARTKALEDQFGMLKEGMDANAQALSDLSGRVENLELLMKPIPERLDALEANLQKANAAVANLQQSFRAVDFGRMSKVMAQQPREEGASPEIVFPQTDDSELQALSAKVQSQDEQLQELRALLQQLQNSFEVDVSALRRSSKALREELDNKPLLNLSDIPEDQSSKLEAIILEFQSRLQRKADEATVTDVVNDVQKLKDALAQLGNTVTVVRNRTSSLASPSVENVEVRLRKVEEEILGLGTNKADRSALEALQIRQSLLGAGGNDVDESALQGFVDTLSKKADRSELLELKLMLQSQTSHTNNDDAIKRLSDGLEELRIALDELKPPGMLPDNSVKATLEEHDRRITECKELLEKLQILVDKKADQDSLLFLKDLVDALKKHRMSRSASFSTSPAIKQLSDETSVLHELWNEVMWTLNDHETVLQQLTRGVLIMSGHQHDEIVDSGIISSTQPPPSFEGNDQASEASEGMPPANSSLTPPPTRGAPPGFQPQPAQAFTSSASPAGTPRAAESQGLDQPGETRRNGSPKGSKPGNRVDSRRRQNSVSIPSPRSPRRASVQRAPAPPTPAPVLVTAEHPESVQAPVHIEVLETRAPEVSTSFEGNRQQQAVVSDAPDSRPSSTRSTRSEQGIRQSPRFARTSENAPTGSIQAPVLAEPAASAQPSEGVPEPASSARFADAPLVTDAPSRPPSRPQHSVERSEPESQASASGNEIVRVPDASQAPPLSPYFMDDQAADLKRASRLLENTYTALEFALKENKIRAKENVGKREMDMLRGGIDDIRALVSSLQVVKADKDALEEIWRYVRANLTENAMFSGKPLLGFKCMSCEHSIEKLNPFRSDYLPTNIMPKQWLSMFTADRLFNSTEKKESPHSGGQRAPSPPKTAPCSCPKSCHTIPEPPHTRPVESSVLQVPGPRGGTAPNVRPGPKIPSFPVRK